MADKEEKDFPLGGYVTKSDARKRALVYLLPHLRTRNLKRAGSVIDTTGRVVSYTFLPHISSLGQWPCLMTCGGIARFLPLTCIDGSLNIRL